MKKMTIAELRRREVRYLADLGDGDINKAASLMMSFYRFCGLNERVFYLENDERLHDSRYARELSARCDRWLDRLQVRFAEYGLKLVYCGFLPSIGTVNKNGGFSEKINRYFYD